MVHPSPDSRTTLLCCGPLCTSMATEVHCHRGERGGWVGSLPCALAQGLVDPLIFSNFFLSFT